MQRIFKRHNCEKVGRVSLFYRGKRMLTAAKNTIPVATPDQNFLVSKAKKVVNPCFFGDGKVVECTAQPTLSQSRNLKIPRLANLVWKCQSTDLEALKLREGRSCAWRGKKK